MKNIQLTSATILLSVIATSPLHAQPKIDTSVGDLNPGAEIALTGSGFGTRVNSFVMRDNANDYEFFLDQTSSKSVAHENLWSQQGSPWADPLKPTESVMLNRGKDKSIYQGVSKAFMGWPEPLKSQTNRSLFVSWWFNPSSDPGANGGSNKFLRVWDSADGNHTRMAWDQSHVIYWRKDVDSEGFIQWSGWGGTPQTWNRIDAWMDADSNTMIISVNGKKVINVSDFKKSEVSDGLTVGLIGFDPSIASNYANLSFGVDDIYLSNTQARVEVSNSPKWGSIAANQREIQTPTQWNDKELKFNLSAAILDLSKPLYIYVVNSSGEVNEDGFPLSSKAPSPVTDIDIK